MNFKELVKITLIPALLVLNTTTMAQECEPGYKWNEGMNRCVYTQSSKDSIDEFESCEEADDKDQCIADAAKAKEKEVRQDYGNDGKKSDAESTEGKAALATTLGTVLGVTSLYGTMAADSWGGSGKDFSDVSMSVKTFSLTSVAGFVKTNFIDDQVDDITTEMKTEYEKQVNDPTSMKDAQVSAFDYLKEEQEGVKEVSEEHEKLFNMMSIGYLVSSGLAAYEIYSSPDSFSCAKIEKSFKSIATSPCTVLVAGITMSFMTNQIAKGAKEIAKEAETNIGIIESLKEKYIASIAKQCPDGREELSQPYCYCYLSNGEQNANRSRSNTCQSLWQEPGFLFADTMDKLRTNDVTKQKGCVRVDGKFDVDCNCKKLKNTNGENACMKVAVPGNLLSSFGTLNTNPTIEAINAINSGGAGSEINDAVNGQTAIADKVRKSLQTKIGNQIKKDSGKDMNKLSDSLLKSLDGKGNTRVAIFGDPKSSMSKNRPNLGEIKKTIASIDGKKSKAMSIFKGGKGLKSKKVSNKKKKIDWGFEDDSSGSQVAQFSQSDNAHMNKKYDYGSNDIIKDKSASIWKAISKRYTTSGLRRLFED